jgi:hypothetical protein
MHQLHHTVRSGNPWQASWRIARIDSCTVSAWHDVRVVHHFVAGDAAPSASGEADVSLFLALLPCKLSSTPLSKSYHAPEGDLLELCAAAILPFSFQVSCVWCADLQASKMRPPDQALVLRE